MKNIIFLIPAILSIILCIFSFIKSTIENEQKVLEEQERLAEEKSELEEKSGIKALEDSYIREYVDPKTGVHYLVYSHKVHNGGMGGITPRLNSDGSIMTDYPE